MLAPATARQRWLMFLNLELLIDRGGIDAINFSWGQCANRDLFLTIKRHKKTASMAAQWVTSI